MTSTDENVGYLPEGKVEDADERRSAADRVEQALKFLEGRWKLVILFHLFGGTILRFSELERAISEARMQRLVDDRDLILFEQRHKLILLAWVGACGARADYCGG